MQILAIMKPSALMLTIGTLAACGGGGGGPAVTDAPTLGDVNSTATSSLVATVLDANAGTVAAETGNLNRSENTGQIGGLSGALSADRTRIEVIGGGAVTFSDAGDGFAARFDAARPGTTTSGIAGIATAAGDLPGGSATYSGDTVITATSGTDLFELTGTADITADFGRGDVTTVLSDLSGVQIEGGGTQAPVAVSDAGTLTLRGSAIGGARFSGGTAALTSEVLSLAGDETVAVEGAFFGPAAEQAGGVFAITGGETKIFGDFLAE